MLRLISLVLLVTSCATTNKNANTAADHEARARHYEAMASSIEDECWKALRDDMTIDPHKQLCWRGDDIRFLEMNRNAAAKERAAAVELRNRQSASR